MCVEYTMNSATTCLMLDDLCDAYATPGTAQGSDSFWPVRLCFTFLIFSLFAPFRRGPKLFAFQLCGEIACDADISDGKHYAPS